MATSKAKKKENEVEEAAVRLGDIVIDPSYQVRMKVDAHRVTAYADCMRMGDIFPPIAIEKKNGKLVCGFTRVEAYQKIFIPDDSVPVIFKTFDNEAERLLYSVRDNKVHGQPLGSWDKKNIICKMIEQNFTVEQISEAIGWPILKVEQISGQVVVTVGKEKKEVDETNGVDETDKSNKGGGRKKGKVVKIPKSDSIGPDFVFVGKERKKMPLKGGLTHLIGKTVSKEVYKNIAEKYVGWPASVIADQLIMRADDNTLDLNNPMVVDKLKTLYKKINSILMSMS